MKIFFHKTFASLKIRNFRLYISGQAVSLCGTWMQTIGQAWLVLKMTHSGTQLGLVTAAQFLPMLVLGPWGGVIADRFSKKKLLYLTQSASGILALILGILVGSDLVRLWMVYGLSILLGLINTIDYPARQSFVVEMVGKEQLTNAVSLNSAQTNLARVIGPAIGGTLIAAIGLAPLFIINAVSYIAVLFALSGMIDRDLTLAPPAARASGKLREGFKYVQSNPLLRNTLLMMAIIGTLTYEFTVILPLLAQFTFQSGASGYALLSVAMGFGSMIGGLYTASRKTAKLAALIRSALLFGATMLAAAVAPNLALALLAMVLVGFFSINFLALGNTMLQLESKAQMRGRVMALWGMAFLGSTPIGGPIIGWIGEYFNPRWGLAVGGFAAVFAAALGHWSLRKARLKTEMVKDQIDINTSTKIL